MNANTYPIQWGFKHREEELKLSLSGPATTLNDQHPIGLRPDRLGKKDKNLGEAYVINGYESLILEIFLFMRCHPQLAV